MKQTHNSVLVISMTAMAALAHPRRFVGLDGTPCAAGAKAAGTNIFAADAGEQTPVDVLGVIPVEAGAAIAAGVQVQSDADGRAVALSDGVGNGWTLDAATGPGDIIRIARGI